MLKIIRSYAADVPTVALLITLWRQTMFNVAFVMSRQSNVRPVLATKIRAAIRSMVAVYCCRIEPFLPALRILAAQRFLLQHLREATPRGADGGGCNDKGQM